MPSPSGIMSWSTAEKSAEPNATIEPLLFTNIFFCTGLIPTSPTSKSLVLGSPEEAVNLFNFIFNATVDEKFVFTGTKSFTLSNGSALSDSNITLFQF